MSDSKKEQQTGRVTLPRVKNNKQSEKDYKISLLKLFKKDRDGAETTIKQENMK